MGSQQSRPENQEEDGGGETCQPCFLFDGFSKGLRSVAGKSDPIGTPLPDTPVYQRRRREQLQEALRKDNAQFSSKYAGLEKEPSEKLNGSITEESCAQIYEGPDVEQLLRQKYRLKEVVGVGSTSTVHRCECTYDQKEYACKIIDCQLIEERFQGMMQQFQTEIEALRQLQHPGIIRLYDVYISDEKIYIVMELMEGGELFDYVVQKGTLTEEEASKIVRKVTSAMVFMHDKNIVHRDLKPENLLLKRKPRSPNDEIDVKVIDFGLSKVGSGDGFGRCLS